MAEPAPAGWEPIDPAALLALWEAYYGVLPETFAALAFWRRVDSDSLWAVSAAAAIPATPPPETLGLRVRRGDKPDTQVSNAFARRYFGGASRHTVRLEDDDAIYAYFTAGALAALPSEGDGYYLVLGRGGVLGRARAHHGELRGEPSKNERSPPVM
ncbi:MAG: hypothetical protein CVU56_12500 [Deltaproteobacteria bacterium HGW-Deltaproteobacteria-14]|nr:MAG: hypothetical protein CVU56_12500 [Deltaproteobacteria bacterium HGW-Deltaproteobacteria-14]